MVSRETLQQLLDAQAMLIDELDDCDAELVVKDGVPAIAYKDRWLGRLTIRYQGSNRRYTVSIGDSGATSIGVGTYWVDEVSQGAAIQDGSYPLRALRGHMLLRRNRVYDACNGTDTYSELHNRYRSRFNSNS